MEYTELTDAQMGFLQSDDRQRLFTGGRQVGHTTALAYDAVERARDGATVAVTAPLMRMGWKLIERVGEIGRDGEVGVRNSRVESVLFDDGRVDFRPIGRLDPREDVGPRGVSPVTEQYDHLVIDNIDQIDSGKFRALINGARKRGLTLSVAGTPRPFGDNVKELLEWSSGGHYGEWSVFYDNPFQNPMTNKAYVDEWMEELPPIASVTDGLGLVVIDPREYAENADTEDDLYGGR